MKIIMDWTQWTAASQQYDVDMGLTHVCPNQLPNNS